MTAKPRRASRREDVLEEAPMGTADTPEPEQTALIEIPTPEVVFDPDNPPLDESGEPDYAAMAETVPVQESPEDSNEDLLIHFITDGFSVLGQIFYVGQELRVKPGTKEWAQVHKVDGTTWMDDDKWAQIEKYGEQKFEHGPWQGQDYDLNDPSLSDEDRLTLAKKLASLGHSVAPGITHKKKAASV